jgi:NAD/NADP transhydrogenase beta subunit
MKLQPEVVPKIKGLLRATLMLLGIAFIALFIYVRFVSPTARETVGSSVLSILLISVLGVLLAASLILFASVARRTHPSIARLPARVFMLLTFSGLVFTIALRYKIDAARIVLYLLCCLLVSLILNLVVYLRIGKQTQHS